MKSLSVKSFWLLCGFATLDEPFQSLWTANSSQTKCLQCHQIDHMRDPDHYDVKIHFDKKSFFLAENKLEPHDTEYQAL